MAGRLLPDHDEPSGPPRDPHARRYDGRLDLDRLDLPSDLDLLDDGHDSPLLEERLRAALDDAGVTAWVDRHRRGVLAGAAVALLAVVGGAVWSATRPVPLPEQPHVLVRTSGAGAGGYEVLDPNTGIPTGVVQSLSLTSAERPGVQVEVVGLEGPGLVAGMPAASPSPPVADGQAADTEQHVSAGGRLDCTAPESTAGVVAASPGDYRVLLRRTAPEGETRVDGVPFVGVQVLRDLVLGSCVQVAAARDLRVASAAAAPVGHVVAADLDLVLRNDSPRAWLGLRVAGRTAPVLVAGGGEADLQPGETGHVHARLWPQDCAHPTATLDAGLPLQVDVSGGDAGTDVGSPGFVLQLPPTVVETVQQAFSRSCRGAAPTVTLEHAAVEVTGSGPSAGAIALTVSVSAPDSADVTADAEGALTFGRLDAPDAPAAVHDGRATMQLHWELPSCEQVVQDGPLRLALSLSGDPRRPYRPEIRGDALRAAVATLCGGQVAAVAA